MNIRTWGLAARQSLGNGREESEFGDGREEPEFGDGREDSGRVFFCNGEIVGFNCLTLLDFIDLINLINFTKIRDYVAGCFIT